MTRPGPSPALLRNAATARPSESPIRRRPRCQRPGPVQSGPVRPGPARSCPAGLSGPDPPFHGPMPPRPGAAGPAPAHAGPFRPAPARRGSDLAILARRLPFPFFPGIPPHICPIVDHHWAFACSSTGRFQPQACSRLTGSGRGSPQRQRSGRGVRLPPPKKEENAVLRAVVSRPDSPRGDPPRADGGRPRPATGCRTVRPRSIEAPPVTASRSPPGHRHSHACKWKTAQTAPQTGKRQKRHQVMSLLRLSLRPPRCSPFSELVYTEIARAPLCPGESNRGHKFKVTNSRRLAQVPRL